MKAPLSWLKEYVDVKTPPKELGDRLTEVGLGTEKILSENGDTVFELEITPNRPDLLSLMGVAREVAAIEKTNVRGPKLKTDLTPHNTQLPITIHPNFSVTPRLTGIIINNVTVKDSPEWLQKRLLSIGQKPINNIVDITNYVMKELGNPIHSFDYNKIAGHEMWVKQAKGGELFESVDEIKYHLPKGAIIYEDTEKIFDLVGIKGGKNSGTYQDTKAVFIVVEVDDPVLIRRASLALGLRSDASAIFERAVNKGGTIDALKRTVDLILECAGGEVASELIDLKEEAFEPWKVSLRLDRLAFILGITIPQKDVVDILERLNLSPQVHHDVVECTIPTYRNDLQIEEDLIEEVARLYGYNNFPTTMPEGTIPTATVPYFKDYRLDEVVKRTLTAAGFSEIYTYSLVSEEDVTKAGYAPLQTLRVDNPVSREFEYLRPTLRVNLLKALEQNKPWAKDVHIFELGKVYTGKTIKEAKEEYFLAGITNSKSFYEVKGMLNLLFDTLGIDQDPTSFLDMLPQGVYFELNFSELLAKARREKVFTPVAKFPHIVEDLSFVVQEGTKTGALIETIKKQSPLIVQVALLDQYKDSRTFHITYQDRERNLSSEDIKVVREQIIATLEKEYKATSK